MILRAARWLVVLAVALFVSSGSIFASAPAESVKSACTESCAKRCPCCISKSDPVESSAPLAPTPSTRTTAAKDFQLVSSSHALLLNEFELAAKVPSQTSAPYFSVSLPIFVRYCAFLI